MKLLPAVSRTIIFALGIGLAGCEGMTTFREGKQLLAEGRIEDSLVKFQEAVQADPTNGEYRSAYLVTRERAVYVWTEQAERARAEGRTGEAEQLYKRILALDPGNTRVRGAIDDAARTARHAELFNQARAAFLKNDFETASTRLRIILGENPKHKEAADLRKTIEERMVKAPLDAKLAAALGKPISIEFRDTPIKQVFEVFARISGLNFIFDRDIRSDLRVTVFLRGTTIQDAVSLVLLTNQLEQRVIDANSIVIYPNTPAKAREYQPLVVRTFFLNNADVKVAANTIRTIVKTRDLIVDERQNMIIMRDTPEAVRLAERLMALHDLPEPEVMLEVEILEVKRTRLMELGVNWPNQLTLTPLSTTGGTTLTLADLQNITSSSVGVGISPTVINLRKTDGDANLLANPRIRSRNREKARILVGDRVPNITTTLTATGFASENVTYIDVGLKLEIEPTIYMDSEVAIKIALEVSNIVDQIRTQSGSLAFQIGTRNANSTLRLKDGENQVLAGLISDEDRKAASKVPGLGDIPILGRLFSSQRDDAQKTEIVLSITPRIVRNPQRPSIHDAEFDAGTEASLRNRGLVGAPGPAISPPSPPTPAPPAQPQTPVPPSSTAATPATPSGAFPPGFASPSFDPPGTALSGDPVGGPSAIAGVGATSFLFQGPAQMRVGDTLTLTLAVQPNQPITSIPFAIGFDPKVVDVTAVAEGDFMRQGGVPSNFASRVDRAAGRVFATATRGGSDGAANSGTLVTLTLRALSSSSRTAVELVTASPIGVAGRSVTTQPAAPYVLTIVP